MDKREIIIKEIDNGFIIKILSTQFNGWSGYKYFDTLEAVFKEIFDKFNTPIPSAKVENDYWKKPREMID